VFAWNQSRHYLPGWYGLGSAIDAVTKDDAAALERLRTAAREDPFFQYVLKNVESAVASTALDVAASYASLVHDAKVRERILGFVREEHARTAAAIEALFGEPLERRRPRMWRTLRLRDQGLRALHAYQVDMLARWRGGAQALLPSVLVSLNAIASGLRTTG
jgi:phosphoenolpyruvate carboxylase